MARGFLLLYHWGLSHPPFWRVFLFWFKDFAFGFKFWFQVIIRFPRCRLLCAPGRVSPQSGSPAPSLPSKVGIRPGFYGAQRTSFPRCGSSVLPGGKVPGGLCLRPCSVCLWGYWCVILSCGSPPF
nr:MAG TPA: hypothetical protein [Caudoviricetes sp.]